MTLKKTALLISFSLAMVAGNAYAQEPSEKEMLNALQNLLSKKQANLNAMTENCKQRDESKDPGRAIMCMTVLLADAGGGMGDVSLSEFEKIGCGKAERAGYICDYRVKVNAPGSAMGPMLQTIPAGVNTKRFVHSSQGWTVIE